MRLTYRRPLALCAVAALALAAPAVAAAHGSGHGHDDHHGKGLRAIKRVVVIYEENHSFDNLYGGWEGVNGLRRADPAHTHAGQPGRRAVHVPAAERRQPDVAAAQRARATTTTATTRSTATSPTTRSRSTTPGRIPMTAKTCPAPGVFAAQRRAGSHRPARRLHARPRAPLLPGAVPAQRRQAESLHDRQRRGRPDAGRTTTRAPCRSTGTCTAGATRLRDRRRLLPGGLRRLVPQPPVAHRRGDADVAGPPTTPAAPTTCTRSSTPTGCRTTTRCTCHRPARRSRTRR